jgi:hypothetical protein
VKGKLGQKENYESAVRELDAKIERIKKELGIS